MSDTYRHTNFSQILTQVRFSSAYYITAKGLFSFTLMLTWLTVGILLYLGVSWSFFLLCFPLFGSLLSAGHDVYRARKTLMDTRQPTYEALEGLKEAQILSDAMIRMYEIDLADIYGTDRVPIQALP